MSMTVADLARSQQRAVIGRPFTAHVVFGDDGDPVPDGSVTVTVTNATGTVLVNHLAATDATGGKYTYPLTAAQLSAPDLLTVEWDSTVAGQAQTAITVIDVCASRLFTLARARSEFDDDLGGFTDAQLEQARTDAEDFLEWQCRRAFTTRYRRDRFGSPYPAFNDLPRNVMATAAAVTISTLEPAAGTLLLSRPFVTELRSVTANAVALTTDQLAALTVSPSGVLGQTGGWAYPVTVDYEHGRRVPDAGRVCLLLARHRLVKGPLDDRAISMPVEGGGVVSLLTPGVKGSITGIAEVDLFIQQNSYTALGDPAHAVMGVPVVSA